MTMWVAVGDQRLSSGVPVRRRRAIRQVLQPTSSVSRKVVRAGASMSLRSTILRASAP